MNELDLMDALVGRLKRLFVGYTLLNKSGLPQEVKVVAQYLPQAMGGGGLSAYKDDDYESNFPSVIVKVGERVDDNARSWASRISVKLLLGVYEYVDPNAKSNDCQAYRDILNMASRIREDLLLERIVGGKFLLTLPLKSNLTESDTWPVYFGEMQLMFETGSPQSYKEYVYRGRLSDGRRVPEYGPAGRAEG